MSERLQKVLAHADSLIYTLYGASIPQVNEAFASSA